MKKTSKSISGTSFHGTTITTSYKKLCEVIGEPTYSHNSGDDKVNFEWVMETDSGEVFTIYDWKEYRPISGEETIEWHIGGFDSATTQKALLDLLKSIMN